jgi:hypothetical protein
MHKTSAYHAGVLSAASLTAIFRRAAFLGVAFLAAAADSARFSAHRFLVAAIILFMPSALIRRFGLAGSFAAGDPDSPLILAHRRCWASFIRRRAAAENFLRLCVGVSARAAGPPESMAWSSPIRESMCRFCSSKPRMAAVIISLVSFVGMLALRINHLTAISSCG